MRPSVEHLWLRLFWRLHGAFPESLLTAAYQVYPVAGHADDLESEAKKEGPPDFRRANQ